MGAGDWPEMPGDRKPAGLGQDRFGDRQLRDGEPINREPPWKLRQLGHLPRFGFFFGLGGRKGSERDPARAQRLHIDLAFEKAPCRPAQHRIFDVEPGRAFAIVQGDTRDLHVEGDDARDAVNGDAIEAGAGYVVLQAFGQQALRRRRLKQGEERERQDEHEPQGLRKAQG